MTRHDWWFWLDTHPIPKALAAPVGLVALGLAVIVSVLAIQATWRKLHPTSPRDPLRSYVLACRSLSEIFSDPKYLEKLLSGEVVDRLQLEHEIRPAPNDERLDLCVAELRDQFEVRR